MKKSYPDFWKDLENASRKLPEVPQKNIILSGMRGSGKSKLGKMLAKKLNRKFYDLDNLVEKNARMPVTKIVERHGWKYFRKLEKNAAKKLSSVQNSIIAAGGGTFMDPENTKLLKQNGIIILLKPPMKELQKRVARKAHRPSLTGNNPAQELPKIWKSREKVYKKSADKIIKLGAKSKLKNLKRIMLSLPKI